jgi:hypothetical protein
MGEVRDIDFFNALQAKPADVGEPVPITPISPPPAQQEVSGEEGLDFTPDAPDASDFFSKPLVDDKTSQVEEESENKSPEPRTLNPEPSPDPDRSGWTIPLLCAGIGIIACCMLIPAADDNRKLVYERERLKADLSQLKNQIEVNQEFLDRIVNDPTLAERLAQRQMRMVREGTAVLQLKNEVGLTAMSPYEIVAVPPPPEMPPYKPVAGKFAELCRNTKSQLFLLGVGLFLAASGLVLGGRGSTETPSNT